MCSLRWRGRTQVHHEPAHRWFGAHRREGWATCTFPQLAFVRLSSQPAVVKGATSAADAFAVLEALLTAPGHEFWVVDYPVAELLREIRLRIAGHTQLTDALLLDLAIRKQGKLATFDRRIASLLPVDSRHRGAMEILPVE